MIALSFLQPLAIWFFSTWYKWSSSVVFSLYKLGFQGPFTVAFFCYASGLHLAFYLARVCGWEPFTGSINRYERP